MSSNQDIQGPALSVVIPAYNRATTLPRALNSVLAQDFTDWEIVVVDDGSSDGTADIVGAFATPKIRLVRHPQNRGAAAARNTGIQATRGKYIAFLDSDDEWLPGKLTAQIGQLRADPNLHGVTMGFHLHREGSGRIERRCPAAQAASLPTLLDGCYVSPGTTLTVRRTVFDQVGLFDEALTRFEDWDWLLRAAETGVRLHVMAEIGALVHLGRQPNLTRTANAARMLLERQSGRVAQLAGPAGLECFRASLDVERLAAAIRTPNLSAVAGLTLSLSARAPSRFFRFLRRGFARWAY